jgi:hypothetical protein
MEYQLVRWQRHGHDRLYVNSAHLKLRWIDLKTGRSTATAEQGWPSPIQGMVERWLAQNNLGHLRVRLAPDRRDDEVIGPGAQMGRVHSLNESSSSRVRLWGRVEGGSGAAGLNTETGPVGPVERLRPTEPS